MITMLLVFYAGVVLVGVVAWFVEKILNYDMVTLRDVNGVSLGMTKKQYRRYMYALGTKNPKLIAKVIKENQTRREQLKAQRQWTKPLIVTLTLACASAAHAQAPNTWAGLAEYTVGEQYYEQGDYYNALSSLKAAWEALPLPVILYDLALTHYKLDNVYMAREYLRAFMKTSHAAKYPAEVRTLCTKLIAAIDEDGDALGLTYAWDAKNGTWGIRRWPQDVIDRYNAEVAKAAKVTR